MQSSVLLVQPRLSGGVGGVLDLGQALVSA